MSDKTPMRWGIEITESTAIFKVTRTFWRNIIISVNPVTPINIFLLIFKYELDTSKYKPNINGIASVFKIPPSIVFFRIENVNIE